jgi:hypothetical protein
VPGFSVSVSKQKFQEVFDWFLCLRNFKERPVPVSPCLEMSRRQGPILLSLIYV